MSTKKLQVEWSWREASEPLSLGELAQICDMSLAELGELVDYGALAAWGLDTPEPRFQAECLTHLRTASRLRQDFDLDVFAVSLLMGYLQRIDGLENQVRSLQAQLPGATERG